MKRRTLLKAAAVATVPAIPLANVTLATAMAGPQEMLVKPVFTEATLDCEAVVEGLTDSEEAAFSAAIAASYFAIGLGKDVVASILGIEAAEAGAKYYLDQQVRLCEKLCTTPTGE